MESKANMRVLLAEDNANMRRTIRHMLVGIGFKRIVDVPDGLAAWNWLQIDTYDLVLCDWNMPGMLGIEVLAHMRADERLKSVPFIMITAEMQDDIVAQAAEDQVDGYIIKPFTKALLQEKIDQVFNRRFNPSHFDSLLQLGDTYLANNMIAQAEDAYNQALTIKFDLARAMMGLALCAKAKKDYDEAEKWLRKATLAQPKFAKGYDELAEIYKIKGDEAKRLEALKTAVAISPRDSSRQVSFGEAQIKCGDMEGARHSFAKAVEIDPGAQNQTERIAEAYLESGKYDDAVEMFERSLEIDPNALNTYNRMGIAYRRQKRPEKAIELYDRALQIHPNNAVVIYNKGCAYLEMKMIPRAAEEFERALEAEPNFAPARKALDVINANRAKSA